MNFQRKNLEKVKKYEYASVYTVKDTGIQPWLYTSVICEPLETNTPFHPDQVKLLSVKPEQRCPWASLSFQGASSAADFENHYLGHWLSSLAADWYHVGGRG